MLLLLSKFFLKNLFTPEISKKYLLIFFDRESINLHLICTGPYEYPLKLNVPKTKITKILCFILVLPLAQLYF